MSIMSLALSIFLLMDPVGNIPLFLSVLKNVDESRHRYIIFRELLIALFIMFAFYFIGEPFLKLLSVSQSSVMISGGVVLFIMAIKFIFPPQNRDKIPVMDKEPFIVPMAMPMVAGPAVLAGVMVFGRQDLNHFEVLLAIVLAWVAVTIILLSSTVIKRVLKEKGLLACERLMGIILIMIAVQMFLNGIDHFFFSG